MKRIIAWILVLASCIGLISVTAGAAQLPFTDVAADAYYAEPVAWAVEKGITNGMTETTFAPDATCTRGQVVTFLHRAAGTPEPTQTTHNFTDIRETDYFYKAVLWAVEKGITNGMTETTFAPDGTCTRGQVVTFLHRTAGTPEPTETTHNFTDIRETDYYYDAVLWAVEKGVTNGMTETTFVPDGSCTRGQVVTFLYRYFSAAEDPQPENTMVITKQPKNIACAIGETATFTVEVTGGKEPYSYQWMMNNGTITEDVIWATGQATDTLSIPVLEEEFSENGPFDYCCKITDADGNYVISETARILKPEGPAPLQISAQPQDVTCELNDTVIFTVEVTGGKAPYSYRWQVSGDGDFSDISESASWATGIDTDTLSFSVGLLDFTVPYRYRCVITDADGKTVTSDAAKAIEAGTPLAIENQPQDIQATYGDNIVFTVTASGGKGAYSYQWQYMSNMQPQWVDIDNDHSGQFSGYTTQDLAVAVTSDHYLEKYQFRCVVRDERGNSVTSDPAAVTEFIRLMIIEQPKDANIYGVSTVEFKVKPAFGVAPYTYQWYLRMDGMGAAIALDGTEFGAEGYNTDTLTLDADAELVDAGVFCKVSDQYGDEVTSNNAGILTVLSLLSHTSSQSVKPGREMTIDVSITGGKAPYRYELQRRFGSNGDFEYYGHAYSNEKSFSLSETFSQNMLDMLVQYRYVVTDAKGNSVQTDPICITELMPLAFTTQPQSITGAEPGDEVTFTAAATGGQISHRYQWYYRYNYQTFDTPIEGATEATYTHTLTETDRKYDVQFFCRVTDIIENSVDSEIAKVTFKLWIKSQTVSPYPVETGEDYTLMVTPAGGSGTYTYQWELYFTQNQLWKNPGDMYSWIEPASVTTSMLKINIWNDAVPNFYQFRCTVSDGTDSVVSEIIKLTKK